MVNQFLIFMEMTLGNRAEDGLMEMKYMKLHPLALHK